MFKKLYLSFILLFLVFCVVSVSRVQAQTIEVTQICLNTIPCNENKKSCSVPNGHRVRLSADANQKPPANNKETYITECVMYDPPFDRVGDPAGARYVCTTGNSKLDMDLFCNEVTAAGALDPASCESLERNDGTPWYDHYEQLKKDIGYDLARPDPKTNKTDYGIYHYNGVIFDKKDIVDKKALLVSTGTNGEIPTVEWQSFTPVQHERVYTAWSKQNLAEAPEGSVGGQQLGTLEFRYKTSACVSVSFDPYGKVFDAVSLEPIPGVLPARYGGGDIQVELYSGVDASSPFTKYTNPNVPNPVLAGQDGKFSFFVENGFYKLFPRGSAIGSVYEFRKDPANAPPGTVPAPFVPPTHPLYNNIYTDIYYEDSDPIEQVGRIEHRDIPLFPIDNQGKEYDIVEISKTVEARDNGDIYYRGRISHPYADLLIYPCADKANCPTPKVHSAKDRTGGPDGNGEFAVLVKQGTTGFYREFRKVKLTTYTVQSPESITTKVLAFLKKLIPDFSVQAQESGGGLVINPIPLYMEGFAYDPDGNTLANAQVDVVTPQSDRPVYSIKADSNGFFRITSEFLPRSPYSLRFVSNGDKEVRLTTTQFLQQNAEFVEKEKINVFRATSISNNPRRLITPSFIPQKGIALQLSPTSANQKPPSTSVTPAPTPDSQSSMLLIGVILLLLLGAAGIMLGIYVYKKNSAPPENTY